MAQKNLNEIIAFQIERTNKIARQHSQRVFDELEIDITVDQWVLLKIIEESEELSQKELAKLSSRDPASITRTLDLLAKKNFIRRETIVGNRRQYNITLTKKGQSFVDEKLGLITEMRDKMTEGFSEYELEFLKNMLKRIQDNLK